jgi:type 1 glutamine amidotransferase
MASTTPLNVLVFSKTTGYRHDSIPAGIRMFHKLANDAEFFNVTASEDASLFTSSSLTQYHVVVLLQNIGDEIFTPPELDALKIWVQNGGGIVAIHGAAAAMQGNECYTNLIGASFDMHPDPEAGTILPEKASQEHQIMRCCGGREGWKDEWYNFHTHPRENKNLQILLRGDPETFSGGKHGADHPLAVSNAPVRTACETHTDLVHLRLVVSGNRRRKSVLYGARAFR